MASPRGSGPLAGVCAWGGEGLCLLLSSRLLRCETVVVGVPSVTSLSLIIANDCDSTHNPVGLNPNSSLARHDSHAAFTTASFATCFGYSGCHRAESAGSGCLWSGAIKKSWMLCNSQDSAEVSHNVFMMIRGTETFEVVVVNSQVLPDLADLGSPL